ncbi:MAG: UDP-N-acetylmuramate dehydrogenase [Clostridia bacterium]|nr:UDP-N-acetylmuramate dehydrogenase [Clostridia bacterium]
MRWDDKLLNRVITEDDFSFSKHTTYGLGGKAKRAYFPKTVDEAVAVFKYIQESGDKFAILGNGSNILASDGYFDGAVICTKYLQGIEFEDGNINVLAGTTVPSLLSFCVKNGLSGLEYLAGIPASVGGLALMNGGINTNHIDANIVSVDVFDGKIRNLSNKNCNFGNKHSTMRDIIALILSVKLLVSQSTPEEVQRNIDNYLNLRKIQPKGKSCGCVFKNPQGYSAGKLIDDAGLKGFKYGCAEVSKEHANFIINNGACANDVYTLINLVKSTVYEKFTVNLEEEVVYIGEFNVFNS